MRTIFPIIALLFSISFCNMQILCADGALEDEDEFLTPDINQEKSFTGKVTRDRVRLRINPSTDSPVVREMDKGEMLLVVDEVDDFYVVKPPSDIKAYLYRKYVLDGVVEGNKVNVRINPHLEAPVITQLDSGEQLEGKISEKNSKWLEIKPPESALLYISSNYIEKIGDAKYLSRYEARKEKVNHLIETTRALSETAMEKPFSEIVPHEIVNNCEHIIKEFNEFPKQVAEAKSVLASFNEFFLRKKIQYLESKTQNVATRKLEADPTHKELSGEEKTPASEQPTQQSSRLAYETWAIKTTDSAGFPPHMALWMPVEISYYEEWAKKNDNRPIKDFYQEQKGQSVALKGILQTYDRPVRNKPGDYLLVSPSNRLPIAYLYSTQVNLQDKLGREVTVEGLVRPNNHFAFPAYFVINAE